MEFCHKVFFYPVGGVGEVSSALSLRELTVAHTSCSYLQFPQRFLVKVIPKIKSVQVFKTNPPTTIAEAVEGVTIHPSS
jgi:hypothetical protein